MTTNRDSSGGYLTGNESERLWDAEEDDAFLTAQIDDQDDEEEDSVPDQDGPIESLWARAFHVAEAIAATDRAIGRAQSLTTFDPNDLPMDELEARSDSLADQRFELEYQMRMRGFPPKGWSPPPGASAASAPVRSRPAPFRPLVQPAEILRPRLTDDEYRHWEWLEQGVRQGEVGHRLGITQAAVSKRERKLRARIDAAFIEATGEPYHWVPIPKPQGGRRRKR